jgi:lambda family phage portal protein
MVKHPILHRLYGWLHPSPPEPEVEPAPAAGAWPSPVRYGHHDGEKFPGGFGFTELLITDYWSLRAKSTQLFKKNIYARGIVRRLVTNIVNTGLALEAEPDERILGIDAKKLGEWADVVENRFHLWERWPELCDDQGRQAFGALQAQAMLTALISGDVLVTLLQDPATGLPRVRLVDGSRVQTPFGSGNEAPKLAPGHAIRHGVELDTRGRHVAFWIVQVNEATGERRSERLAAVGPETGRRQAWLVYGTDKLLDEVRGEPMLSLILQSLHEIDRYRDAVQRKALINSIFAMFIKKEQEGPGTRPLTGAGGAVRKKTVAAATTDGAPKTYKFTEMIPGAVLDELAPGESPQGFASTGTDEKFSDFESAVIHAIAWCYEMPPEILELSFSSNYSASQAAINEFKLFLNVRRSIWGDDFCQPVYVEWLLSEALGGRVAAPGLLEAWRDPTRYDRFVAWVLADWTGAIKPSVDLVKQAEGYSRLGDQGFITRARATREVTGTKYAKNVAQLVRENEALALAREPLAPPAPVPPVGGAAPPGERKPPAPPRKPGAALALVESSE